MASVIISLFWSASLVESTVEVAEKQITPAADQRVADIRSEAYAQFTSDLDILQGHVARLKTIFTDATFLEPGDLIASARTDIAANTTVPVQDHHHWVFGSIRRPQCVDKRSRRLGGCFRSV